MAALMKARAAGALTEGVKKLPAPHADFLVSTGAQAVYLRGDGSNAAREIEFGHLYEDLRALLPSHGGEVELCKCPIRAGPFYG